MSSLQEVIRSDNVVDLTSCWPKTFPARGPGISGISNIPAPISSLPVTSSPRPPAAWPMPARPARSRSRRFR